MCSRLVQGFSLLSASDMRNIKLPVMQVALIFARDTWSSLIALVLALGAAGNASSWVVIIALPKMRQVGHKLPNLQQVWLIYTKLAVNMAVQAILGVFLAVLGNVVKIGSAIRQVHRDWSQYSLHFRKNEFPLKQDDSRIFDRAYFRERFPEAHQVG